MPQSTIAPAASASSAMQSQLFCHCTVAPHTLMAALARSASLRPSPQTLSHLNVSRAAAPAVATPAVAENENSATTRTLHAPVMRSEGVSLAKQSFLWTDDTAGHRITFFFFLMIRRPPRFTLFPYTPLFE